VHRVEHHAALAFADLSDFMAALRAQEGTAARALEFTILTAAHTSEIIGARWCEIDMVEKVWTAPSDRMKAGREHRVPLSARAVAILEDIKPGQMESEAFVFPGSKAGKPLSNMAIVCTENLNPNVMVMKAAKDRV
jgi:integrase